MFVCFLGERKFNHNHLSRIIQLTTFFFKFQFYAKENSVFINHIVKTILQKIQKNIYMSDNSSSNSTIRQWRIVALAVVSSSGRPLFLKNFPAK